MLTNVKTKEVSEINESNDRSKDHEFKQYLTFQLSEEFYGLNLLMAKEIITLRKITAIPNTEEYALGVINLRGKIVPIFDLKSKFNLLNNNMNKETQKIIIVSSKNVLLGFLVDNIREVVEGKITDIEKLNNNNKILENDYFKGILKEDNDLINIIDLNKVIFDNKSV